MDKKRLVIIDGNSLVNRAYYAIQRPMITKEGLYTQGVYGFIAMLKKIRADYAPTHMLIAFDRKAPTFRHKEFSEYKAGRKKMPMELVMQLPILKDVLSAMNVPMYEIDGFEADDIIGTVAKMAEAEGDVQSFIITGDKDELQLATDKTSVIITKKGISEFALYDDKAMMEEYGFDHKQFIDYKGLMGDPSDNIPGIAGVGQKTAVKLILQFGTMENMLANTDKIANEKLRTKIEENAQIALMSKRLATIVTTVPVDFDIDSLALSAPDKDKLIDIYSRLEFKKLLKDLMTEEGQPSNTEDAQGEQTAQISADIGDYPQPKHIEGDEAAMELFRGFKDDEAFYIDVISDDNHVKLPSMDGLEILKGKELYIITDIVRIRETLSSAFDGKAYRLHGFNLGRLYYVLAMYDIDISGLKTAYDGAIAQYVLSPSTKAPTLSELIFEAFHEDIYGKSGEQQTQLGLFDDEKKESFQVSARKLHMLELLSALQEKSILDNDISEVFYDIELPLVKVLSHMEAKGFHVDKDELSRFGDSLRSSIVGIEERIYEQAGGTFNINSPQQLGIVLFEKLQLPGAKKTKTGYATNADVLDRLSGEYPIVADILEYRTLSKLNSTYVEGMLPLIDEHGNIHAHFRQTVTATGRISCTEPNLQNIPIRQELGRSLRKAFTAESDEYCLIGADYSQIELRVLAHMSDDSTLIQAFNDGVDIHRQTASKVFGVPLDDVTDTMRSNAKAVNFGVIYGMSSFGLSNELTITRKEAEKYIADYFEKFGDVKRFMDNSVANCKTNGFVRTLYGRKRAIPEINVPSFMVRQLGERLAMNSPIQGTAADIIKLAMIHVYDALLEKCPKSELVLQIHDELIIQAHISEKQAVKTILQQCMEQAAALSVKLSVSLNEGNDWYSLK